MPLEIDVFNLDDQWPVVRRATAITANLGQMNRPVDVATSAQRRDVQALRPAVGVTLSRVGVTNVEKIVRIATPDGEQLFYAQLDCFVDLAAAQKGVHMSRFEEVVNEAIDEVVLSETFRAEVLAGHIADLVRERQQGARAEVSLKARYPEHKAAPESGSRTQSSTKRGRRWAFSTTDISSVRFISS